MGTRIGEMAAAGTLVGTEIIELSKRSTTTIVTGTTLSFSSTDNSLNDSGNGLGVFDIDDSIEIYGASTGANNKKLRRALTVAAGKITFGADGDDIVTESAGATITAVKLLSVRETLDTAGGFRTESFVIAASDEVTALTTGTAKVTFRMPYALTLTAVRASLTTAQSSGSTFTVDVNEGGSTILSTKITIDNTEKTSTTAATPPVISDSALADDAEITIDIDQVGDGTAKGLKVILIGRRI